MKKYTLYQLQNELPKMEHGAFFQIKGQLNTWELYDENIDYFFVRNTISKQLILLKK